MARRGELSAQRLAGLSLARAGAAEDARAALKPRFPQPPHFPTIRRRPPAKLSTLVENPVERLRLRCSGAFHGAAVPSRPTSGPLLYSAPHGVLPREAARDVGAPAVTPAVEATGPAAGVREPAGAGRRLSPQGAGRPAHRHLRHAHQPASRGERGGTRLCRRSSPSLADRDVPLLPRAGRAGALHRHPRGHREPHPRVVPRRGGDGARRRSAHQDLRPRARDPDKDRAVQPGFTTATARAAAVHPRRRFRAAHRPRVAGLPAGRPHHRGQSRRRHRADDQPSAPAPRAAPATARPARRSSSRPARSASWCSSWSSARPAPRPSRRELAIAPATAFRELGLLEKAGLVHSGGDGKRTLTEEGVSLLDAII